MPFVPAVCYTCHTIFSSELFVRDIRMNLPGLEVKPCPTCSNKGRIIGGMYEFIDYTLTILKNDGYSIFELNLLYNTFMNAQESNIPPKQLKREIKNKFPESIDLLLLLPETTEDYQLSVNIICQILLAVMELSIDYRLQNEQSADLVKIMQHIKVVQTIDQIYTQNSGVKRRFL